MALRTLTVMIVIGIIQCRDLNDTLSEILQTVQFIRDTLLRNEPPASTTKATGPRDAGIKSRPTEKTKIRQLEEELSGSGLMCLLLDLDRSNIASSLEFFQELKNTMILAFLAEKESRNRLEQTVKDLKWISEELIEENRMLKANLEKTTNIIEIIQYNMKSYEDLMEETRRDLTSLISLQDLSSHVQDLNAKVETVEKKQLMTDTKFQKYVNIAKSRPTQQSSTHQHYGAALAVDGVTFQQFHSGSCSHTATERDPWWMVDLGEPNTVAKVTIYNRGDCCGERLRNFTIRLSNTTAGDDSVTFARFVGSSHTYSVLTLENSARPAGRFLKIQIRGSECLTLSEVQVYSEA